MANARVLPRAMVAPTSASLVAGSGRATATPPASAVNRSVVAARAPTVQPSFAQRQALLQKNAGQPLSMNQMRSLATQPSNVRGGATGTTASSNNVRVVGDRGSAGTAGSVAAQPTGANATTAAGMQNSAQRESSAQSASGQGNNGRTLPKVAGGNQPDATTGQQGHVRSATFAHAPASGQGANASNRGAEMPQQRQIAATSANTGNGARTGNNSPASAQRTESASRSPGGSAAPQTSRSSAAIAQRSAPPKTSRQAYTQHARSAAVRVPHNAPQQRMPMEQRAPQQAIAQHGPPPQQHGPGPGPQRQTSVARTAPQHAPPHGNKKDGGGG
jgi:hypothetical protein